MLITSPENYHFLDLEVPLVSSSSAAQQAAQGDKKSSSSSSSASGVYEITLPTSLPGILPTYVKQHDDAAGASVRYYFEVRGTRKGLFHSNDKLQLDFKVCIPLVKRRRELKGEEWPVNVGNVALKFKNDGGAPLMMKAKVST